ncbi:hypothetical protein CPB83DRAFT_854404, partial [Crepidotus variabilis]
MHSKYQKRLRSERPTHVLNKAIVLKSLAESLKDNNLFSSSGDDTSDFLNEVVDGNETYREHLAAAMALHSEMRVISDLANSANNTLSLSRTLESLGKRMGHLSLLAVEVVKLSVAFYLSFVEAHHNENWRARTEAVLARLCCYAELLKKMFQAQTILGGNFFRRMRLLREIKAYQLQYPSDTGPIVHQISKSSPTTTAARYQMPENIDLRTRKMLVEGYKIKEDSVSMLRKLHKSVTLTLDTSGEL